MMDIKYIVAENLRAIRERRRISLDSAARLTGVSKSMLGQIERAEVNPTISVCWKIADGLRVSFSELVDASRGDARAQACPCREPMLADEGRYRNHPVFTFDARTGFEQYRIVIEPSGGYSAEAHMAGTEEFLAVFCGMLLVRVDGVEYRLEKGDGLRFHADVPHAYENIGTETVEMSMVIHYQ